jgi:adenylosuccinate lyase
VLMQLAKRGADRQAMHERLRGHSMTAWAQVTDTGTNPLYELLAADGDITALIAPEELRRLLDAREYVGDAPRLARALAAQIRTALG